MLRRDPRTGRPDPGWVADEPDRTHGGHMTDDDLRRLRRERKAAIAALDRLKRPPGNLFTRRRTQPSRLSLGHLVKVVEAEARVEAIDREIDRALDERQAS